MNHPLTGKPGTLAMTLLRAVDRFTGGGAVGGEGPYVFTPEGECLGEQKCRLALYPYAGDHVEAAVAAKAAQFTSLPYTSVQSVDSNKFLGGRAFVQAAGMNETFYRPIANAHVVLPHEHKLFALEDEAQAMVLTACKATHNRDGAFILRLYNTTDKETDFAIKLFRAPKSVCEVNLAEDKVADRSAVRGKVALHALPKQIVTVRVEF
jgi:alpha-mannosidase